MNRTEAQQLLELCRPGNEADRQDPALAQAFALLESDAELKAWFEAQQALDARISEQINSIKAPADLKASILAGMRLHQAAGEDSPLDPPSSNPHTQSQPAGEGSPLAPSPHNTRSRAWWLRPWIGIAAVFAIVMIILNLPESTQHPEQTAIAGLPPVLEFLSGEINSLQSSHLQFDKRDSDAGKLRSFLASNQAPSPQTLPRHLDKMPTIGCLTLEYQGARLSMICFKGGKTYHLITADKANYPGSLPITPEVFQCRDKTFRVWVDGEQVKILSVEGSKENIPEFI